MIRPNNIIQAVTLCILLAPGGIMNSEAQNITAKKEDSIKFKEYKPEIFTSGFIDLMNSGQVNASARFIRLFIGEPGKIAVPLSLYGGVSNNNFQNQSGTSGLQKNNNHLVTQYINPLSGLLNISVDGIVYFKRTQKPTKKGFLYHAGERILTGYKKGAITDPQTGNPVNFLNSFLTTGVYFQTGAWERNNAKNMGIFWMAARFIICYTNPKQIKEFLPDINTNGIYHGYSIGFGVEINNFVNLKLIYYKYLKNPEIDYFLPIYQFSFNYSLKN
ncbi:MAG TPA: hypothetical protein VK489_14395 [Ferruginibacter sp.]|nr:hypothetical protein [Ferruginibacter sp.]